MGTWIHTSPATTTTLPDSIAGANLKLWLKADAIVGKVNNDTITTWADSSGNNYDAAEATNPPTYKTSVINSLPVVRFDGSNDEMKTSGSGTIANILTQTAFSVWLVGRVITYNTDFGDGAIDSNGPFWTDYHAAGGSNIGMFNQATGTHISPFVYASGFKINKITVAINTPVICHMRVDSGSIVVSKNGDAEATVSLGGNSVAFEVGNVITLGRDYTTGRANVDIGELVFCNSALDSSKRASMLSYLNSKWAVY